MKGLKTAKKWMGIELSPCFEKHFLEISHLILRAGVSLMIMTHGFSKISKFSSMTDSFPDPLGIGSKLSLMGCIGAEFFGGIFLALGLLTRLSASLLLFVMLVIVFIFHAEDPFKAKELAILYGLVFLALILRGGGRWSLDHLIRSKL